ncbi:hypothetical protein niasHT_027877 [Heterodera trifolii]|uniref:Uncharacterized protein n=1 Tax=Heterodera trifolii TaxID=157864 RepID=A0ABD2KJF6_9BILA
MATNADTSTSNRTNVQPRQDNEAAANMQHQPQNASWWTHPHQINMQPGQWPNPWNNVNQQPWRANDQRQMPSTSSGAQTYPPNMQHGSRTNPEHVRMPWTNTQQQPAHAQHWNANEQQQAPNAPWWSYGTWQHAGHPQMPWAYVPQHSAQTPWWTNPEHMWWQQDGNASQVNAHNFHVDGNATVVQEGNDLIINGQRHRNAAARGVSISTGGRVNHDGVQTGGQLFSLNSGQNVNHGGHQSEGGIHFSTSGGMGNQDGSQGFGRVFRINTGGNVNRSGTQHNGGIFVGSTSENKQKDDRKN